MSQDVRAVDVRGGSNGVQADVHDLTALARVYGGAALDCGGHALALHGYLVSPAIASAAVLDPVGAARFEWALLQALDGSHGLSRIALDCTGTGTRLRATAASYVTADRLRANALPAGRGIVGLPDAVREFRHGLRHGGIGAALSEMAATDPALADTAVDVLSEFWQNHLLLDCVAALPDGRADVRRLGPANPAQERPAPHSVRDVMAGLARRNAGESGGDVDVRFVYTTDAAGARVRRVIVDIPGTKNWTLSSTDPDPTNLNTNLKSIAGARTTYQQGVLEVMRQAGVGRGEQVLLVGHSQGGMVAVNVAEQAAHSHEFTITNVITAGSPIARLAVPANTQVLSLENEGDVVPHADGASNPDRRNQVTVTVHRATSDALINHDLERTYLPGAGDVDASADPSVRSYLRTLQPFLTGSKVQTVVYHVARR